MAAMQTVYGVIATIGLIAFIVFTFRQGFSVKPRKPRQGENSASDAYSLHVDNDIHRL